MRLSTFKIAAVVVALFASLYAGRWVGDVVTSPPDRFARLEPIVAPASLFARSLEGRELTIDFVAQQRPMLAFVLSVDCTVCRENAEAWVMLADSLQELTRLDIVVLSTSAAADTREFVETHKLHLPVHLIGKSGLNVLKLPGVPATLLLHPGSRRVDAIIGLLEPSAVDLVRGWVRSAHLQLILESSVALSSNPR